MPGKRVKDFLDLNGIQYVTIMHSPAFTAQGIAESAHISGKKIAKTVVMKINNKMAMAVLTADCKASTFLLKDLLSVEKVEFASEEEFKNVFPDCEVGAMPPFGNLYGMDVFVSKELDNDEDIAFNAGTHTELIHMKYKDYKKIVKPTVVDFSMR